MKLALRIVVVVAMGSTPMSALAQWCPTPYDSEIITPMYGLNVIYPASLAASDELVFFAQNQLDEAFYTEPRRAVLWVYSLATQSGVGLWYKVGAGVSDVAAWSSWVVVSLGDDGLTVLDVSDPFHPQEVDTMVGAGQTFTGLAVAGERLYVAAGSSGLRIVDVSDPSSVSEIGALDVAGDNVRSVAVAGSLAYLADSDLGLRVVDVSNPAAPVQVGGLGFPSSILVAVSPGVAYVADLATGVSVVDVSDPSAPQQVSFLSSYGPAHGVTYHDGYLYVQYDESIRIYDVATPSSLVEVGAHVTGLVDDGARRLAMHGGFAAFAARLWDYPFWADFKVLDLRGCPVSWWPGDGDASDRAGANDGTATGTLAYTDAQVGQGFLFDGAASGVTVSDDASLDVGGGDLSFVYWVETTAGAGTGFRVILDKRSASPAAGYHLYLKDGRPGVQLGDGTNTAGFVAPDSLADGRFHMVALTIDRSSSTGGRISVDRRLQLVFDPTVVPGSLDNGVELRLGRRTDPQGGDGYFEGIVDEIRFYDRVLGDDEIDFIFVSTAPTVFVDGFEAGGTSSWSEVVP